MVQARVSLGGRSSGPTEIVGRWWHAGHPEISIGGTLLFDPERGAELRLSGSLVDVVADLHEPGVDALQTIREISTTIHGISQDNIRVTLLDPRFGGSRTSQSKSDDWKTVVYLERWHGADVLVGDHASGQALDRVVALTVETRLLPKWVLAEHPDHQTSFEASEPEIITITRPDTLEARFDDVAVSLTWLRHSPRPDPDRARDFTPRLEVSMTPAWRIASEGVLEVEVLRRTVVEPLLRFATLATEKVDFVTAAYVVVDDPEAPDWDRRRHYELLSSRFEPVTGPDPDMSPHRFTIPHEVLADRFPRLIEQWLELYRGAPLALDDYFGAFEHRLAIDERFMRTVRGIEQWHSLTQGGVEMDREQWRSLKSKVKGALDDEEWRFVSTRLSYGNRLSLRRRVLAVAEMAGHHGGFMSERLARLIVRERNGLTHGFGHRDRRMSSDDRWWAMMTMRMCMTAALLGLLGFTDEERAQRLHPSDLQYYVGHRDNPLHPARLAGDDAPGSAESAR